MSEEMPSPPFPDPKDALLKLIVERAIADYRSGEISAEGAILHAAVHGWLDTTMMPRCRSARDRHVCALQPSRSCDEPHHADHGEGSDPHPTPQRLDPSRVGPRLASEYRAVKV